jgi:transposase InsO family protein
MTTKAAFNAEEWGVITTAPVLAAMSVMAADRGGSVRESLAISRAYAAARGDDPPPLLKDVLATPPALDPATRSHDAETLRRTALEQLRQAVRTLERLATDDEVVAYKRFVYSVAENVARAHREGGFLGVGGKEVSQAEQQALDAIAAIFDEPRPARDEAAPPEA